MVNLYAEAQSVEELVKQGVKYVPDAYIQSSPALDQAILGREVEIPIIDLSGNHADVVRGIQQACQSWGFFQVVNHGVPLEVIECIWKATRDFFDLPMNVKMEYFAPEVSPFVARYGIRLNDRSVVDWRDYLSLGTCYPLTHEVVNEWPGRPPHFRIAATSFLKETRELGLKLLELISESLGLPSSRIMDIMGTVLQVTLFNRYLPCPQPELVLGVRSHSDPGALTLLIPNEVPGLQVRNGDTWYTVRPAASSFIVNIGDHMQIITNGRYKSAEHRVLANATSTRYSVATFMNPRWDLEIGPLQELLKEDEEPHYENMSFGDYIKNFIAVGASSKATLEAIKFKG